MYKNTWKYFFLQVQVKFDQMLYQNLLKMYTKFNRVLYLKNSYALSQRSLIMLLVRVKTLTNLQYDLMLSSRIHNFRLTKLEHISYWASILMYRNNNESRNNAQKQSMWCGWGWANAYKLKVKPLDAKDNHYHLCWLTSSAFVTFILHVLILTFLFYCLHTHWH